jgi:DNA (cytosine-5)-methyltransferase 3A
MGKINVLSLFDGMSCGRIALDRVGIEVENYYASEIDKYAIQISNKNYPNIIQIGDVTQIKSSDLPHIDLLIGGSPCQSFSVAGDNTGFDGKSGLFWEYVRLLYDINPKYFLLENVIMKKEWEDIITEALGVEPIKINSSCFTAQNRKRLYWTNIPNIDTNLSDSGLFLRDIVTSDTSTLTVEDTARNLRHERNLNEKSLTCTATMYKGAGNNGMSLIRRKLQNKLSVLNVHEVEKLQSVPFNYTEGVSNTQRYKMLGNGWTVDVIAHIFQNLKQD